jgi:hypothetical protein
MSPAQVLCVSPSSSRDVSESYYNEFTHSKMSSGEVMFF